MRIVYFGTPDFSAAVLEYLLIKGVSVVAVVTQPDKLSGRTLQKKSSPVKELIGRAASDIPVFQPNKISDREFIDEIRSFDADLFLVVAFGQIFPKILLDMPPLGCVNIHTSLLPKYRGAAPIHRCVMNGEKETGVTVMYMAEKLDAGDIITAERVPVGDKMTFGELEEVLSKVARDLIYRTLDKMEQGSITPVRQDEELATYAKKVEKEEGEINWTNSAKMLHNLIRGMTPRPGAWCRVLLRGRQVRMKIHEACPDLAEGSPGEILSFGPEGAVIGCRENSLRLVRVQLEGKKTMNFSEFAKGYSRDDISFSFADK